MYQVLIAMLRECPEHSYFRGECCPYCNEEGKFLMNENEMDWFGRTVTGILRHFPEKFEVTMDEHGWVDINEIIDNIRRKNPRSHWLKPEHVIALAKTDEKGRYQIKMGKIRATYGHSLEVKLDLPTDSIPDELYYPSSPEEAAVLMEIGIHHSDRAMVHLSDTKISAREAGSHRVKSPVVLNIDAKGAIEAGVVIYRAGNHVFTTDFIPSEFISITEE